MVPKQTNKKHVEIRDGHFLSPLSALYLVRCKLLRVVVSSTYRMDCSQSISFHGDWEPFIKQEVSRRGGEESAPW